MFPESAIRSSGLEADPAPMATPVPSPTPTPAPTPAPADPSADHEEYGSQSQAATSLQEPSGSSTSGEDGCEGSGQHTPANPESRADGPGHPGTAQETPANVASPLGYGKQQPRDDVLMEDSNDLADYEDSGDLPDYEDLDDLPNYESD